MSNYRFALAAIACSFFITGCATDQIATNSLSPARISSCLKKGDTTQAQVIEQLGAPNIITLDSNDREVWTYQRHSISGNSASANIDGSGYTSYGSGFFSHGFLRGGVAGSTYSESSKTLTLTIKFDRRKVVDEFKSIYTSF